MTRGWSRQPYPVNACAPLRGGPSPPAERAFGRHAAALVAVIRPEEVVVVVVEIAVVAWRGLALALLQGALGLVARNDDEVGRLAGLFAQLLVGDNERRAWPHVLRDAGAHIVGDRDALERSGGGGRIRHRRRIGRLLGALAL